MTLKQTIERAFADVSMPEDGNITHCPYHCSECGRIAAFFKGRSSGGLTLEEMRAQHVALSLFTPDAFHYFLPAFMLASLGSYEKGDVIPDAIRFHFECSHEMKSHFAIRLSKFTPEQREAIIEYLVFMEEKGAGCADHAIEMLNDEEAFS